VGTAVGENQSWLRASTRGLETFMRNTPASIMSGFAWISNPTAQTNAQEGREFFFGLRR